MRIKIKGDFSLNQVYLFYKQIDVLRSSAVKQVIIQSDEQSLKVVTIYHKESL